MSSNWDEVAHAIENSLPPIAADNFNCMATILTSILEREMQVWVIHDDDEKYAILTTTFSVDLVTKGRCLLVYSLFGYKKLEEYMWVDGIKQLRKYAREMKCEKLIAFSSNDRVLHKWTNGLSGVAEAVFLSMEV